MEKPNLSSAQISANLRAQYRLEVVQITALTYGADADANVYRVTAQDGAVYFLKIRRGKFDNISLTVLNFLHQQPMPTIIAPIPAHNNQLWVQLDENGFTATLYPFIEGRNGFEETLTDSHWHTLGKALKQIHTTTLPSELAGHSARELFEAVVRQSKDTSRTLNARNVCVSGCE